MNQFLIRLFVLLFLVSRAFAGSWSSSSNVSDPQVGINGYLVKGNGVDAAVAVWNSYSPPNPAPVEINAAQYGNGAWGAVTNVYPGDGFAVSPPVAAINSLGRSVAVWQHNGGNQFGQYVQGSYFNGTSWTSAGNLTQPGSDTRYPAVTLDGSGVATAVWVEDFGTGVNVTTYIRYARSVAGGAWTAGNLSPAAPSNSLRSPLVTVDTSGVVTAVWQYEADANNSYWGLKASRFDPNTTNPAWSSPVDLISTPNGNFGGGKGPDGQLNLSAAGDGAVYVSWVYGSNSYNVQVARYSAGQWSTPIDLGAAGAGAAGPALTTDGNSATVVWNNGSGLLTSVCAPNCGAGQSIPNTPTTAASPFIALDATGTAMVGWLEGRDIKASIRWGGVWLTPQSVGSNVASTPPRGNVAAIGQGNFEAAWQIFNTNNILVASKYTSVAPGTPGRPTAVAGSASATVTVAAPSGQGAGDAPTSYRVTASPSGRTCLVNGSSGSCTITGLTNGTAYTFTSTASNPAGTSGSSQPSTSVTPGGSYPGTPGAPTASVASSTSVTITVTPPLQGAAPTSYTVTNIANSGNTCTVNGASGFCTVSGLTTGSTYTFTSTATNGGGTSAASPTVTVTIDPPNTPGTPTAVAGNAQATVTVMPASGGGTPTNYTVTSSGNPAKTCTVFGPSGACTVTGLSNGTAYTFTSVASNAAGNSNPSAASAPVTPAALVPGAPTNVVATAGNARASLSWAAPVNPGGSAIIDYTVTSTPASTGCVTNGLNCTVSGLSNGTAYTFTVVARNSQGPGPDSQASSSVTPSAGPIPSIIGISPSTGDQVGGTTVTISGAALTGATAVTFGGTPATNVSVNGAGTLLTATTPASAGGPVDVVVTTAAGSVTQSEGFTYAAPPASPGTPLPAPGDGQVTVSWPQVFTGGGYPTSYTATAYNSSNAAVSQCTTVFPGAAFPTASCTVTGLTNGQAYTFVVRATNGLQPDATSPASAPVTPQFVINGLCGAANGVATMVEPTGFLCSAGAAGAVTSSQGNFVWSCAGQNGGSSSQCSAPGTPSAGTAQGSTTFKSDDSTSGCSLKAARMIPPPSDGPGQVDMPFGVVNFEMTSCSGDEARVRLTFASSVQGMEYWKYVVNEDPNINRNGWYQMPANEVALVGNTAEYTIVDNGPWDSDPAVGAIADPGGPGINTAAPGVPGNVSATAGNGSATVSWTAPTSGGTPTSYLVTANTGQTCTANYPQTSCTVTGLTNGLAYTFTVRANNSGGSSNASAATMPVVPNSNPIPIPTMQEAALMLMSLLMLWLAYWQQRKH